MKKFFTHNIKLRLQAQGKQAFADDPKVLAVITNPGDNTSFYITGYLPDQDMLFGYVKGNNIEGSWGNFPVDGIERLHHLLQGRKHSKQMQVIKPTPISEFFPNMKEAIAVARLDRIVKARWAELDKKDQELDQEI